MKFIVLSRLLHLYHKDQRKLLFYPNYYIGIELTNENYCLVQIVTLALPSPMKCIVLYRLHCHCNEIYCFIQVYTFIMYGMLLS